MREGETVTSSMGLEDASDLCAWVCVCVAVQTTLAHPQSKGRMAVAIFPRMLCVKMLHQYHTMFFLGGILGER